MNLFNFDDYRAYLRNHIESLPGKGRGELSKIAKHLEINSTLLSQIMSGSREFTLEQAIELSLHLKHSRAETDYFLLLVQYQRAANKTLRDHFLQKMKGMKEETRKLPRFLSEYTMSEEFRTIYYSSWLYIAVHTYTGTHSKGRSLEDVAERFRVSQKRAREILKALVEGGLCRFQGGHYQCVVEWVYLTGSSVHASRHHSNWRMKSAQKAEAVAPSEFMATMIVSLSKTDFAKLRDELSLLTKRAARVVKDSPPDEVACMTLELYWVE